MTSSHTYCLMTEGSLTLPAGYSDRTVNVFTAPDAPGLNISRDRLDDGENLTGYIDRQLAMMAQQMKGWKNHARGEAPLGDGLCQGEFVEASFLRDGKRIAQRQAVFAPDGSRVLVFTVSTSGTLTDADRLTLTSLLQSFRFNH